MSDSKALKLKYAESDLDFLIDAAALAARDRDQLRQALREDEAIRRAMIADDRVFQRVMGDDEQLVRVSPALYFEVLLRKAERELQSATHTMEQAGAQKVPVFDTAEVAALLRRPEVIECLAEMLASFTRVESYTVPVRVRRGVWRKLRYSDTDIDSLMRLCETADEEHRLAFYKRIADLCLFILGIFPEHAPFDYRYSQSGEPRPQLGTSVRRGMDEYETEGRRFYKLAGEHPAARDLELAEVFQLFHEKLTTAKKPLNFISEHYLALRRRKAFNIEG